jgi:hypothetical protein
MAVDAGRRLDAKLSTQAYDQSNEKLLLLLSLLRFEEKDGAQISPLL